MRSYGPDDPIEQPASARGQGRGVPEWVGILLMLLFGVGFGALAWLYAASGSWLAGLMVGAFALLVLVMGLRTAQLAIQSRRFAREMRAPVVPRRLPAEPGKVISIDGLGLALKKAPIRINIYRQEELPALPVPYQPMVTASGNILGQPPRRILYLYNFFSSHSLQSKMESQWRRFGPVYYLGSPQDESYKHSWTLRPKRALQATLLSSDEAFDRELAVCSEEPLPPGDPDLKTISYVSGGYPQHSFLCTDANWQYAVTRLFRLADCVVLDATGYNPLRAGLNWELGYVIQHVATERFVVLTDGETDHAALGRQFRVAWQDMRSTSPNNRPNAGPVRFVLLKAGDSGNSKGKADKDASLPMADPAGVAARLSSVARFLLAANYQRYLLDERIFGLIMGAVAKAQSPAAQETGAPPAS